MSEQLVTVTMTYYDEHALSLLPKASECEKLVVGESYLVPCINNTPVIGEPHTDDDHFNNTPFHFHTDSRFADHADVEFGAVSADARKDDLSVPEGTVRVPKLEPRVCIRDTPKPWDVDDILTLGSLYAEYGHTKLKCATCPHKGMPVINGVCSGHRLEWLPDGTCKHKPPFTIRIVGTENQTVVTDPERFIIPMNADYKGEPVIEIVDRDGVVIGRKKFEYMEFFAGDQFRIAQRFKRGY